MKADFLEVAKAELFEALSWYEEIDVELSQSFYRQVFGAVRKIEAHPEGWRRIANTDQRRINLNRFPYFLAYRVREESLYITAVIHQHSDPKHWQELLQAR